MLLRLAPLVLVALASACSGPQGPSIGAIAPVVNATLRQGEDLIEPGDLLAVRFAPGGAVDYDQDVRVQPDGRAAFRGLDGIDVGGLLPSVLDEMLTARYATLLRREPTLDVAIVERGPRAVTVFGEVARPGGVSIPATGRLTLVEAIGRAGGVRKRTAWLSNVRLLRWDVAEARQRAWTIDARQQHWSSGETVFLQSGDVLYVPNTNVDRVALALDNYVRRMIPLPYLAPPAN